MAKYHLHKATCPVCQGHGYFEKFDSNDAPLAPINPWGAGAGEQYSCTTCGGTGANKGRGWVELRYEISEHVCLDCKGKGLPVTEGYKTYLDSSGVKTRERVKHQPTCKTCFGVGKLLYAREKLACQTCHGLGQVIQWRKSRLAWLGVKTEVEHTAICTTCKGSGKEWRSEYQNHGVVTTVE